LGAFASAIFLKCGYIVNRKTNIIGDIKDMIVIEENVEFKTDFDKQKTAEDVAGLILEKEGCPFECEVDILITDSEEVKEYNKEYRDIDNTTDVLSFPNLEWEAPSDFDSLNAEDLEMSVNPETNLTILGEICLNKDRILSQAEDYGHSVKREYAFLIAHSMLHLLGYDHMEEDEAKVMEEKQSAYLDELGIKR